MRKLIIHKTFRLCLVLFVMSILVFLGIRLMPGDPIDIICGDKTVSDMTMNNIRSMYHLDEPLWKQYLLYVKGLLHGELGYSYFSVGTPVTEVISRRFGVTFRLAIAAFPCAAIAGVLLGILAAMREGKTADRVIMVSAAFFTAVPDVPLAAFLVYVFAVKLKLLPIAGWGSAKQMILPVTFITIWPALSLAKTVRSLLVDEWRKSYAFVCRTRGMRKSEILIRECFPNIFAAVATQLGMMFGKMLEGALIAELVFNIPGLGRCSVDAIFRRDYPVIMAVVLLSTFIYTVINYAMEILQLCIDPRVREGVIIE